MQIMGLAQDLEGRERGFEGNAGVATDRPASRQRTLLPLGPAHERPHPPRTRRQELRRGPGMGEIHPLSHMHPCMHIHMHVHTCTHMHTDVHREIRSLFPLLGTFLTGLGVTQGTASRLPGSGSPGNVSGLRSRKPRRGDSSACSARSPVD